MDGKRKVIDCREMPSERNCTVSIAGTEEEVVPLAVYHAVHDHGHEESSGLEEDIRAHMHDEVPAQPA